MIIIPQDLDIIYLSRLMGVLVNDPVNTRILSHTYELFTENHNFSFEKRIFD